MSIIIYLFKKVATWERPPSGSDRSKRSFWQGKMQFFADKNTSCYCLSTIKSATCGGLLRQAERLPFLIAKLSDDFNIHTIKYLDNKRQIPPLEAKRKIARFSSFSLLQI
jgi:hypothetical protein